MRKEKDQIGEVEIEDNVLYGIHSYRARLNFPETSPFHIEWYKAIGTVKKACYYTLQDFYRSLKDKYYNKKLPIRIISDAILQHMSDAAGEIEIGKHFPHFIIPAISGGAGTSINMNVNEIIANVSLLNSGHKPGEYSIIDPIEDANIYQSTNDVIPTALKVSLLHLLQELELSVNSMRGQLEELEKKSHNILRIGYTQMQEAVPTSFGRMFGAYNDALSRDWWRISKCSERIKQVNLGGSAIGSGITIPRFFIMEVVKNLQQITRLPLARAENLLDATSNLDAYVEIHAILKAHAVNLEKMVNDLRLLGSDTYGKKEIHLPEKQAGSSIMPGKINPVIPEYIVSIANKIFANDMLVSNLCGLGCLELNAYIPIIGHAIIESLKLLISANQSLTLHLVSSIKIDNEIAYARLLNSPAIATALLPFVGYHKAGLLARNMKENEVDIVAANDKLGILSKQKLTEILKPENLLKEGFIIKDILDISENEG